MDFDSKTKYHRCNMEMKADKKNYSNRIHQFLYYGIIFQSVFSLQVLCLMQGANLQQDIEDKNTTKREIVFTFYKGKQETTETETDQMQRQAG